MLVKELIEELKNCPQEAKVIICTNSRYDVYEEVENIDDNAFFTTDGEVFGIEDEEEEDGLRKESKDYKRAIILVN